MKGQLNKGLKLWSILFRLDHVILSSYHSDHPQQILHSESFLSASLNLTFLLSISTASEGTVTGIQGDEPGI